jgi:hypothetical protein
MLLPSSSLSSATRSRSWGSLFLILLPLFVVAIVADPTPCELGTAGCVKKKQQPVLANNNSSVQKKNDSSWVVVVSEEEEEAEAGANNVPAAAAAAQEDFVPYGAGQNDNHGHHTTTTTQFDLSLSPPPPLKQEEEVAIENTQTVTEGQDEEGDDDDAHFHFPLLQERIAAIRAYLHDPMFYLVDMDVDSYMHQADLSSYSIPASNLVAILEDLEFQLENNVTLALEFYALGGWHLVASLVAPAAHGHSATAPSSHDIDHHDNNHNHHHDVNDKILVIRAYATSLLGAIIKSNSNPHESDHDVSSWVIEQVQIDDVHDMVTMRTTPLHLVAQAMVEVSMESEAGRVAVVESKCSDNTVEYQHQLAKECMRTLDAFLRGNRPAHVAFSALWTVVTPSSSSSSTAAVSVEESTGSNGSSTSSSSPAKILGHQVALWANEAATTAADIESSNAPMSRHSIDMATRLLALVKDIVQDVDNLQKHLPDQQQDDVDDDNNKNQNAIILSVLSTQDWCHAAMQAATLTPSNSFKKLVFSNLQKTALQTVVKLGPHCSHHYSSHLQDETSHDDNRNDDDKSRLLGVADLIRLHQQLVQASEDIVNSVRTGSTSKRVLDNGILERERERIQLVEEALAAVTAGATTTTTILRTMPQVVVNEQ